MGEQDMNETGDSIIAIFAENTSLHGPVFILKSPYWSGKLFWSIVLLVGIGVFFWVTYIAWTKYLEYPVETTVSFQYSSMSVFPAVTFCNMNPIRLSDLQRQSGRGKGLTYRQYLLKEVVNDRTVLNLTRFWNLEAHEEELEQKMRMNSYNSEYELFLSKYMLLDAADRALIGHHFSDVFLSCRFNGMDCSQREFTRFSNSKYGNCWIFNLNGEKVSSIVGPQYGLILELYIEQGEYVSNLADSAGIRVAVHNQSVMPFPEDEGFDASPGLKTSVGLKKTVVIKAAHPYGTCQEVTDDGNIYVNAFVSVLGSISYTSTACKKTCLQRSLVKECKCFSPHIPYDNSIKAYEDLNVGRKIPPCNQSSIEYKSICVFDIERKFMKNDLGCESKCAVECRSMEYSKSISTSVYPSNSAQKTVINKMIGNSAKIDTLLEAKDDAYRSIFVKENVIKMEIYFEDLNYKTIQTEPSYTYFSVWSDIGGQAGLWLGFSAVTTVEILELLLSCLLWKCRCFRESHCDGDTDSMA